MSGVNHYLKEKLATMDGRTWVVPDIPAKKLANAIKAFKFDGSETSVIGICDNTLLGSAKEGILLTGSKLIYKKMLGDPVAIDYSEMESVTHDVSVEIDKKGKKKKTEKLQIQKKDGKVIDYNYPYQFNLKELADILNGVLQQFDNYKEQDQLQPIAELPEDLKVSYIKIIVNMTFDDDGQVDDEEFAEILRLMTRIDLSAESRSKIRKYMGDDKNLGNVDVLIKTIDANAPDGLLKSIHISLVKDLISIHSSLKDSNYKDFSFLNKNRQFFDVSDDEIDLAQMAIENDKKTLNRAYTDNAITKSVKELSAKAGAVGVPLGAVYLSGSVMGLSAAGMTSGLATLGMGGILGLSSMATGVGAAVILGVVAYKGLMHFADTGIEEGDKRREIMLQEVVRQGQRTMNMVIEDINFLTKELSAALTSDGVSKEQLKQLQAKISQYVRATKVVGVGNEQAEAKKLRLKSPEFLDVERLKSLTAEHEKKKYFEFIMKYYREETVETDKNGERVKETRLRLIESGNTKEMEQLGQVFELLGYTSTQAAIKGKIKGMFGS